MGNNHKIEFEPLKTKKNKVEVPTTLVANKTSTKAVQNIPNNPALTSNSNVTKNSGLQEIRNYKCTNCQLIFAEVMGLAYHMQSVHAKSKQLSCNHCQLKFDAFVTLKSHVSK